jgi:hypothetical protein
VGPQIGRLDARLERILAFGQRCARDAAVFLHPQLQAILAAGQSQALRPRRFLSAAIGTRLSRKAAAANGLDALGLLGQPNNSEAE